MQADGTILEICHIADDFDQALMHWTTEVGAGPFFVFDVPVLPNQLYYGEPTQVAMRVGFGFSGGVLIELLKQTNEGPSPFLDFARTRGEGLHHLMLRGQYDESYARYVRAGYRVAFSGAMPSGERFCLFDTCATHGYYTEFMDQSETMRRSMESMHQAHVDWDGKTDPVRGLAKLDVGL